MIAVCFIPFSVISLVTLTTLISEPHLGHAFTLCLADAWAHYAQLRGNPALLPFAPTRPSKSFKLFKKQVPSSILLTSGTDEHGTKVAQAAKLYRKSPKAYVDEISPLFKMLCQRNSVALSDFIRTTDERHKKAVEAFWSRLDASGHIYESSYSGWYSVSDETFYSDWEIATPTQRTSGQGRSFPDRNVTRVAIETGSPVEWMEERTYMFRVTAFKRQLHEWLDSGGRCLPKVMVSVDKLRNEEHSCLNIIPHPNGVVLIPARKARSILGRFDCLNK
ncbi:putative Methionine-tRNA synthetase [Fasciola gigantica]|uniref:Putative Methionine-tRNA synthetase n=1 Tax=Fasciola gigantica TaxID=46835 RepID=A0A504Z587_FASGI|nr:putative Methionine-tRNA synthetase [Fasciola gigantica]